jgi:antitoxin MazE
MRGKISKWGNSLGVRFPKPIAAELGLSEGQVVEISAAKDHVEVRPVAKAAPHYTLEELVAEMERLGPENRPAFEDWGVLPSEWPQEDWSDIAPTDEEVGIARGAGKRTVSRRR